MKRTFVIAAALGAACAVAGPWDGSRGSDSGVSFVRSAFAAADEAAAPADPVAEATRIRDEAKLLFRTAGDPDADAGERSKARKECFKKLKTAKKHLDDHLAAHPDQAERLDALYCDVASTLFWVKKELTLEEMKELLGGGAAGAPPSTSPGSRNGSGESGIGGVAPRGPGNGGGSSPGPNGGATPSDPPSVPPEPAGPTPADGLAEAESYAREHPGDVPGQYEKYSEFLERFSDPSTPEYAKAAAALQTLGGRMKDVYRVARDDDPDTIRSEDPAEVQKRLKQLLADLASSDDAIRVRAARFLGYLGSPEAAVPLLDALKAAPEGPVREATAQALADIGGRRVFDRLVKAAQKDSTLNAPVVDVLRRALAKGGPGGRLAGETLAQFAEGLTVELQTAAVAALKDAGAAGAVGLAYAASYAPDEAKADLLAHAGSFKDPRSVAHLSRFLFVNPSGMRRDQASSARDAIEAIGKPGVRYLIPALDEPTVQLWSAELLRKITGTKQKDDKRKTWESWYRKNRRTLE